MNSMAFLHDDSPWGIGILVVVLVLFACIGVAHVINPDWFIKRSGVPKGGEMLTGLNRYQFRAFGVVFAGVAMYMLYRLLRDVLAK